jgi:hypothetical protein
VCLEAEEGRKIFRYYVIIIQGTPHGRAACWWSIFSLFMYLLASFAVEHFNAGIHVSFVAFHGGKSSAGSMLMLRAFHGHSLYVQFACRSCRWFFHAFRSIKSKCFSSPCLCFYQLLMYQHSLNPILSLVLYTLYRFWSELTIIESVIWKGVLANIYWYFGIRRCLDLSLSQLVVVELWFYNA